uniref:uncharacterized protein LOC105353209 n=1 Tax=Fragaria vesca subsp. vesca TaxID=101020 RepID=UPI0005C81EE4|nr:PREDICTED: uncharacterized protein LOC105353209 [Fragaria vesca subsp. vesca]
MASSADTTPAPSDNAAPRSTALYDDSVEGSEIPVEVTVERYYVADAEVDRDSFEYTILYCPITRKGMKLPSAPGQPQASGIITTAQSGTGAPESSSRGGGRAPPTYEGRLGVAVQRGISEIIVADDTGSAPAPAPPNCKFPFDLNVPPPRDDDDEDEDDMGDTRPGLVA